MGRETPIWLGDLFEVLRILRPRDGAVYRRIARLLQIDPQHVDPALPLWEPIIPGPADEFAEALPEPEFSSFERFQERLGKCRLHDVRLTRRRGTRGDGWDSEGRHEASWAWLAEVEPLPPPDEVRPRRTRLPEPLLEPRESRAIWSAALRTRSVSGDIDVQALVADLCAGRPILEFPRLRVPRMARRVDVLVDTAPAMDPYALDWWALVNDLVKVAGRSAVRTWFFLDCPGRGVGSDGPLRLEPYRPRESGIATLVVSDFGLAPAVRGRIRAGIEEWLKFLAEISERGASPVGLLPYPPSLWPASLAGTIPLVYWDRATSAGRVHRAVRDVRDQVA